MQSLIQVVEANAETLASRWMERIRREEGVQAYLRIPQSDLQLHITGAYKEIGLYLDNPGHEVIRQHFTGTGRKRRAQGHPLRGVVRAIQLAGEVLWQYVLDQGHFDTSMGLYQGLDLQRKLVRFWDRAVVYAVEGYHEETGPNPITDKGGGLPIPLVD